ncbi:YceD family protein [Legionella micdadei]|uniref:Large ribosomal RNA subunit accumulation protein YceD n=1 Tax=Legionella micdadei TaxID=451 RepID=A0A098GGB6_LEGMI|nr:YceD family protein [Legionella micdadei]ARG97479.1 metal-binding protein [Legionella micdadei]ARH00211.1 metal-binding protein [Legionella micdadei]KTD28376.1 metal-binding protein [Legionella micdadei]NSL17003.1 DUF177 domain-containing protein [Legionella micdadei]CEG61032.1 conserved protein of unknown function [Legionella micdadei]
MLINLKNYAIKEGTHTVVVELSDRLPARIQTRCSVNCQFDVKACDDYYLLTLNVDGVLNLTCQRCLDEFSHHYHNQTELAICRTDEMAEKMMEKYESIVAKNNHVDLAELITDELHLYAPEFHLSTNECNSAASKFITLEQE